MIAQPSFRFADVELFEPSREVRVAGWPVALGDRAFDLLLHLCRHPGRLVDKQELLQAVWPDKAIEDANLHVQVSLLRRAIGAAHVVTVHGRGYRLAAEPVGSAIAAALDPPLAPPLLHGRESALRALEQVCAQSALVTLVGPGGVGKTQLARAHVARRVAAGVACWWVDLASLMHAQRLAVAVERALGLDAGAEATSLAERAVGMRGLLVLDNAEHLRADVAGLVRVLARAPGLRLLVTSREALGPAADGEQLFVVEPLALPGSASDPAAAEAPAVKLFVDRARAVDPRFALGPDTLPGVVKLCRQLDGLPLSLELAAARLPLLGLDALLDQLDGGLQPLRSGAAPRSRHHSLEAVLAWSHEMLSPREQLVFRRLAVMTGGFTLELAAEVVGVDDYWAFVDAFESLLRKHLVTPDRAVARRWRLLHTTRMFAAGVLDAAGETGQCAQRHASALARYFAALHAQWLGGGRPEIQIDAEAELGLDDLCAALDYACVEDPPLAARLLFDGARWLRLFGLRLPARRWADALESLPSDVLGSADVARLHASLASVPSTAADAARQQEHVAQAASRLDGPEARAQRVGLMIWLAHRAAREGRARDALDWADGSERLSTPADPPRQRARGLELRMRMHDYWGIGAPVSEVQALELLADLDAESDGDCQAAFLLRIGVAERQLLQGRFAAAREGLAAVCQAAQRRWAARAALAPFDTLAAAQVACGELEDAAANLRLALDAAQRAQLWTEAACALAWYLVACGRVRAAVELAGAARAHVERIGQRIDLLRALVLERTMTAAAAEAGADDLQRWLDAGAVLGQTGLRALLAPVNPRFAP